MRKLFLLGALAIGGFAVTAQEADVAQLDETEVIITMDDFAEIEVSEVPTAVTEALSTNFPTAKVNKAYANEEKQYKLEVSLEDGTSGVLYADENGNWLDM